MGKIDTSKWEPFKIRSLFTVKRPAARSQSKYDDGDVPFVASGNHNNGVLKYLCPKTGEILDKGNCITVSPIDGSAFYQKNDFLGRGGAGSSIIMLYNDSINEYSGCFIATIISTVCKKYYYSDMANKDVIAEETIMLPVDENHQPDFSYMEEYMKNREIAVSASLTKLHSAKQSAVFRKIDVKEWRNFHLYDIFEIDSGTKLDKAKMDTAIPKISFVGRSNFNNGITQKVNEIKGLTPYDSGCLTLALGGAYLGSCFIQEEPFYTSQNVAVLIPKENITFEAKQFIATAIFKESQNNYRAFIKELNAHIKRNFVIKLPVNTDGDPNYDYMTAYISKIKKQSSHTLEALQAI